MSAISVAILEEIGFEGLDGITFDALWKRLEMRGCFYNHENFFEMTWSLVLQSDCIQFYQLPEPRRAIQVVDRRDDEDIVESDEFYSWRDCKMRTADTDLMGICSFFEERVEIPKDTVRNVTYWGICGSYGSTFIMVATQEYRESLLFPDNIEKPTDIAPTSYAMLEIIGKSRFRGETTNGPCALQHFMRDSGMIFYFKKKLTRCNLITQQLYCRTVLGHGLQRSVLLHLPRFYKEHKSKYCLTIEKIAEYLKLQPNLMASYDDVKQMLISENLEATSKKLFKLKDFQKFVETDIRIPYRQLHPNAPESHCIGKNRNEKIMRAMQLRDPHVDVTKFWMKDDQNPDDDEELDDPEMVIPRLINVPLHKQIYQEVENSAEKGLSQTEVRKLMGLTRLQARGVMQNMLKMRLFKVYTADEGRQRTARFILPKYHVDLKDRVAQQEPAAPPGDEVLVDEPIHDDEPIEAHNEDSLLQQMLVTPGDPADEISVEIEKMDNMMRSRKLISENIKSARMLRRLEIVQQLVKKRLILTDLAQITKIVIEREKKCGQKETVCRKTVEKIITLLRRNGHVNIFRITLRLNEIIKVLWFTCDKSVQRDHALVHQAIAKAKALMMLQKLRKEGKQLEEAAADPAGAGGEEEANNNPEPKKTKATSKLYTNVPKFVRLRLLHEFLFYLVYELPHDSQPLDQQTVLDEWREVYPYNDVVNDLPPIYGAEFDWKMFIPPLKIYRTFPPGWVLFQDVLLRIPLTLLVKMFPNKQLNQSVQKILEHPIKKNLLLSQLPTNIRVMLMRYMTYSRYVYEVVKRLCFMGLAQLGPQNNNSSISSYVFINRNAAVINTSSSSPGYIHIEEKKYPMTMFHFSSLEIVEKYWDELMMVCFATRLGFRKNHEGKEVIVEVLHTKPDILATLTPRQPLEAIERDTGDIPGDHLGAGGLDCSFFAHIKGSWKGKKKKPAKTHPQVDIKPFVKLENRKLSSVTRRPTNLVQKRLKTWRSAPPKAGPRVRTITRKKQARIRTTNYDEIDKKAISMMKTLRVTWTAEEDNVLLLCKIAIMYFHEGKKMYVSGHTIRDILHYQMNSIHMTSRACTRRIVYMMKNPATKTSVENCLCEVRENELIRRRYGEDFVEKLKTYYQGDEFLAAMRFHFINLFIILNGMFTRLTSQQMSSMSQRIPNTIGAFWEKFRETNPEKSSLRYTDPVTHDEILQSTIYSLIYSSMCTAKDKCPYNLQLFEIYKNYSNEMLGNVMDTIRNDQLISYSKAGARPPGKKVVPLQQGPFHLSNLYIFHMIQHVSYGIYDEMWQMMKKHRGQRLEVAESVPGVCFLLAELFTTGFADVVFEMPKKLLVFSNEAPTDTPYERIASRFHNILSIVPSVQLESNESGGKGKSQKKVAFVPDHDFFIYRQFSVEQLMKLQNPFVHVICFLYFSGEKGNQSISFDEICPFSCLFNHGENLADFSEIVQDILTHMNPEDLETSLGAFIEIVEKIPRVDDRDPGKTQCKRITPNLLDIFRDLIEEATTDQSTWIKQFYQTDGDDDGGDCLPNIWQIRRNLGTYSNIDEFSEKSQRIDNYLVLKDVRLHYEINAMAPILMDEAEREEILEKVRMRSILRNPTLTIDDILARFEGSLSKCAKSVLDAIVDCREFGITVKALERRFREFHSTSILAVLESFLETGIIVQMGVVEYTFVYWKHAHPWLVKSFNVTRLEKEAEEPMSARLMDVNAPSTSSGIVKSEEPPAKRQRLSNMTATISIKREDDLREPKILDRDSFFLRPYPWIRVNGSLNRRVLDKWLGVVLIFLTKNPGVGLIDLAKRFNYLHPTHLKLLLEVLEDIQCIQIFTMRTSKCTLRSQYQQPETENAHRLASFEKMFVEVLPEALTRLTSFIGEKKYKSDFV